MPEVKPPRRPHQLWLHHWGSRETSAELHPRLCPGQRVLVLGSQEHPALGRAFS